MKVVQVSLRHKDFALVTYVEQVKKLKVGCRVTLKDHSHPDWWWVVEEMYLGTAIDSSKLYSDWKVGGL
jgi:hypothetical protein